MADHHQQPLEVVQASLGGTPLAVLDVGSNTVHLVVVDGQPDGSFAPVARERETLRLPEGAAGRLTDTVARMRARADELRADALVGFATSAIRGTRNLGRPARALPEAPTPPHAFGFADIDGQTARS